jgi:hypothetical protein
MGLAKDCYLPRSEMKEQVKNPAYGYYTAVTMSEVTLRIQTETETVGCFREWRVTAGGGVWVVSAIIQVFDFAGGHTDYGVQITDINSLD